MTLEGQGQPNLTAFAVRGKDWEMAGKVINQSKLRLAVSTFKPFKSAGAHGTVSALLQQVVNLLMTHLCHSFRACLARQCIPRAWRKVKVTLSLNLERLTIPRLWHTDLLIYSPS